MGDVSIDSSSSASPANPGLSTSQGYTSSSAGSPHPNPNATCWEILTLRLGRFAREHIEKHGPNDITDEMLQTQARQILYDCDDPWNQTAADNPEWLGLFKKAHGIDSKGPWPEVISQHDILEDLGLGPTAQLDRSFNLSNFQCVLKNQNVLAYECSLSGSMNMAKRCVQQDSSATSPLSQLGAASASGAHLPITSAFEIPSLEAPISELVCTTPGGVCIGENGELGFSVRKDRSASPSSQSQQKQAYFYRNTTSASTSALLAPVLETACTLGGGSLFASYADLPSTTAGEAVQDNFHYMDWDQLANGFDLPPANSAFNISLPATMLLSGTGLPVTSGAETVEGTMGNPQVMRWDDNELGFGMDMDMDLNLDADMMMGDSNANQQG